MTSTLHAYRRTAQENDAARRTGIQVRAPTGAPWPSAPRLIELVDGPGGYYLWVGNDAPTDKWCYVIVDAEDLLEGLARDILRAAARQRRRSRSIAEKAAPRKQNERPSSRPTKARGRPTTRKRQ